MLCCLGLGLGLADGFRCLLLCGGLGLGLGGLLGSSPASGFALGLHLCRLAGGGFLCCLDCLACGFCCPGLLGQLGGCVDGLPAHVGKLAFCCSALQQSGCIDFAGVHWPEVFLWLAGDALSLQAQVRDALGRPGFFEVLVLDFGPQLAGGEQALLRARAVFLAAALFWVLRVRPFEKFVRVAGDAVQSPFAVHDVRVRLLALFDGGFWNVDGVGERVPFANLLFHEIFDQLDALRRGQLAGQSHFNLSVGRAVRALMLIGGLPKNAGVMFGPGRHVARGFVLQVF